MNRRQLLGLAGWTAAGSALWTLPAAAQILSQSKPGLRLFDVKAQGATGDGQTLDTAAINRTIEACHAAGGGVVYFSPGVYLSGTVVLKSNV
ncbi:MAG TPA: glycosyl hydrolase family 28-related protein, partial [Candidatus Sulfotelmatobacter sp.]|nr:glycosyl hydrolase family 28-related protein [Candidatus Sulfotelmatobacter sp.]